MSRRILGVLGLSFASGLACAPQPELAPNPRRGATVPAAPWVQPRAPGDASLLELPARVHASGASDVAVDLPVPGRLVELSVRVGDPVRAGDPLATVAVPELAAAVASRSGTQREVAAYGERARELEALRREGLVGTQAIFEVDRDRRRLETATRERTAMLEALGLDATDRARLRRDGLLVLRAPSDGVVTRLEGQLGRVFSAGEGLAEIRGTGPVRVEAAFTDALPTGVEYAFVDLRGRRHPLDPTPVATSLEPGLGRELAWFVMVEEVALPDGLLGRLLISVDTEANPHVFEIPRAALRLDEGRAWVLRLDPGGAQALPVPVEVLRSSGSSALIRAAGLGPEDLVSIDASVVSSLAGEDENAGGHAH